MTLTIDGPSVVAFNANRDDTHFIVPSERSLSVPGWHRTNQASDSLKVTEYARSAVAEALPGATSLGTITAGVELKSLQAASDPWLPVPPDPSVP